MIEIVMCEACKKPTEHGIFLSSPYCYECAAKEESP